MRVPTSQTYWGSDEERGDLLRLFEEKGGDMGEVFDFLMLSRPDVDSHRFADAIDEAIGQGKVKSYAPYKRWRQVGRRNFVWLPCLHKPSQACRAWPAVRLCRRSPRRRGQRRTHWRPPSRGERGQAKGARWSTPFNSDAESGSGRSTCCLLR